MELLQAPNLVERSCKTSQRVASSAKKTNKLVGYSRGQSRNWASRLPSLSSRHSAAGKVVAMDAGAVVHPTEEQRRLLAMTGQSRLLGPKRI